MDHSDHTGHEMAPRCAMNMLWNTQVIDTCIVFRSWHISSNTAFAVSFLIIVGLGVLYEYMRVVQRVVDQQMVLSLKKAKSKARLSDVGTHSSGRSTPEHLSEFEEAGLLTGRQVLKQIKAGTPIPILYRLLRAGLYGASVFLSFFLMLVFMTYNAYLIMAVVLGAAIGHYVFGGYIDFDAVDTTSKGMACH